MTRPTEGETTEGGGRGDDFTRRLASLEAERRERPAGEPGGRVNFGLGARVGTDLVAGVLIGVGLGYGVDLWFGTKPWGLIVCFIMGAAAGFLNVYRFLRGQGLSAGYRSPSPSKHEE